MKSWCPPSCPQQFIPAPFPTGPSSIYLSGFVVQTNRATSLWWLRAICLLHRKSRNSVAFWQGWNQLNAKLGQAFHGVWSAVSQAMRNTPRSSALVENLNSRLRNYLTLRRHLDGGRTWPDLLKQKSSRKGSEVCPRLYNVKNTIFEPRPITQL